MCGGGRDGGLVMGLWLSQGVSQNGRRMRLALYLVGDRGRGAWVRDLLLVKGLWRNIQTGGGGRLPYTCKLWLLQGQRSVAWTTHG